MKLFKKKKKQAKKYNIEITVEGVDRIIVVGHSNGYSETEAKEMMGLITGKRTKFIEFKNVHIRRDKIIEVSYREK